MNDSDTVKNDFFGFPKVKWLQYTGEAGNCTICWCQIFSRFKTHKHHPKSFNFWQSYLKTKKADIFWDTVQTVCADFPNVVAERHILGVRNQRSYDPKIWTRSRFLYNAPTPKLSYVYSFGSYRVDKQTNTQTNRRS